MKKSLIIIMVLTAIFLIGCSEEINYEKPIYSLDSVRISDYFFSHNCTNCFKMQIETIGSPYDASLSCFLWKNKEREPEGDTFFYGKVMSEDSIIETEFLDSGEYELRVCCKLWSDIKCDDLTYSFES